MPAGVFQRLLHVLGRNIPNDRELIRITVFVALIIVHEMAHSRDGMVL